MKSSLQVARLRKKRRAVKLKKRARMEAFSKAMLEEMEKPSKRYTFTGRLNKWGHLMAIESNEVRRYIANTQLEFHKLNQYSEDAILTVEITFKDGPAFLEKNSLSQIVNITSLKLLVLS